MIKGLYEAASGLVSEAKAHEIRANNLANVSTVGYKKDSPFFRLLTKEGSNDGSSAASNSNASCVTVGGTAVDFSQGPLRMTGNVLDLAIEGEGFFVVQLGEQEAYTRAGNFRLGPDGSLLSQDGLHVLGRHGKLSVPEGAKITVGPDGELLADGESIDNFSVVTFEDLSVLEKAGGNLFTSKTDQQEPVDASDFQLHQGFLESSNANIIEEMVSMIDGLRRYESHQKGIHMMLDDSVGKAISSLAAFK